MKQMLRKLKSEKGFTLVELLAVIVILGIILAIAIPAIGGIMENAKNDTVENQEELILDAARLADVNGDFTSGETTATKLIEDGYLEDFDENTDVNLEAEIHKNDNSYSFEDEGGAG